MLYPLKFEPLFKGYQEGYIWGGRNFEKLGKTLTQDIVAESWEVSCHPDGVSIIANGEYRGLPLPEFIRMFGRQALGRDLLQRDVDKFPLLVKFIDANADLSVQVHPDDEYAFTHENGEYGKNEMWYILSAVPGAKLIYDVVPGITRESFRRSVAENNLGNCLKTVPVYAGDVINIPAGVVHAVCKGILLAEVQQNSNTTYRVYDYDRVDKNGNKRPLHIEKALDVIDFDTGRRREKYKGLEVKLKNGSSKKFLAANRYFSVELYDVDGCHREIADGSRFSIYTFIEGKGEIVHKSGKTVVALGDSVLIPASMGEYDLAGRFKALKSYVPDIPQNVLVPLENAGYSREEIRDNVGGIYTYGNF